MRYEGIIYRPPSEANSLIIQLTIGCARNTCTFCSMYREKKFCVRPLEEVKEDLRMARAYYQNTLIKKIFLADGDALIVPTKVLLELFNYIYTIFPEVERISMYGAPRDILVKKPSELEKLKAAGLYMVYMGIESGSDAILQAIQKGVTREEMIEAGRKVKEAGILLSATLISGLGGKEKIEEHARESARVVSAIQPDYVGFLTLMVERGTPMAEDVAKGLFAMLTPWEVVSELEIFLTEVDSDGTIFRANHASNYVSLRGTLNTDKHRLLEQIRIAKDNKVYKPEVFRGL